VNPKHTVLSALLLLGLVTPAGAVSAAPLPGESPTSPATVTLITGDRVTLNGTHARVQPGRGRERTRFIQQLDELGNVHVIPEDATAMLRAKRMDPRLFNVTKLAENGYDDRSRPDIPLIVSGPTFGAKVRDLPSVRGAAVRVDKAIGYHGFAANQRIWLDGPVRAALDQSVPQIGAPEAWKAGFKGQNTTVAVLDSGIDTTHPDLTGAVVDAQDFTGSATGPDDYFGHGTHVASTITGENAKYEGVAPDTKLLNGKVLNDGGGGAESWIIAGMQWAADKGANVVNMSLGSPFPADGTDPISVAVNEITAGTGTLFVIAAGNSGGPIGSPGAADAALTVGAVDHNDQLAPFSSRGPRWGDEAIKPDITAPGVDITAAKAAHATIGTPVDATHMKLSGTSMATPHVAGAAAILAGEHPAWKADQLKSALMGSAKPTVGLSVFEQGAGRVDVAKAVRQNAYATPASLSEGLAQWPHNDDTPITKALTYHNSGTDPLTLNLTTDVHDPAGKPAPAGMFTVTPATLTVPAGGQATATVTSDTRVDGPDGIYSGVVLAGDVRTPIEVNREIESYNVKVGVIGFNGAPTDAYSLGFVDIDHPKGFAPYDQSGTVVARLPKGRFYLDAWIQDVENRKLAMVGEPEYVVTGEATLTLDAREAKQPTAHVDKPEAKVGHALIGFERRINAPTPVGSNYDIPDYEGFLVVPSKTTAVSGQFRYFTEAHLAQPDGSGAFTTSPYFYHLHKETDGKVPTDLDTYAADKDLAKVRSDQAATTQTARYGMRDWVISRPLPYSLDEYYTPDVPWMVGSFAQSESPTGFPIESSQMDFSPQTYELGQPATVRWNYGVFGPAFTPNARSAQRLGDQVAVVINLYTDQGAGRLGGAAATGKTVLSRDGKVLGSTPDAGYGQFTVPPGPGTYQLHTEGVTTQSVSTSVTADWTFKSDTVTSVGPAPLPLLSVRFAPTGLDGHNRASRALPTIVPVTVDHNSGGTGKVTAVQVSYDQGKTWKPTPVITLAGRSFLVLAHPAGAKSVSFKASAKDAGGNTVDETIIDGILLK
jgi:subtilisin family serine protease